MLLRLKLVRCRVGRLVKILLTTEGTNYSVYILPRALILAVYLSSYLCITHVTNMYKLKSEQNLYFDISWVS